MKIKQSHELRTLGRYGVLVIGAGPSGICASVSSSRMGISTAMIERYGTVGGNLTTGFVGPIMGGVSEGTISQEVWTRLGIIPRCAHDYEKAKIDLALFLDEAGVDLYLQSMLADVIMEENRIVGVVLATPDGLHTMYGDVIVDATGDGTTAALAGAPHEFGRNEDGLVQPVSLMFVLDGVSEDAIYCQGINPDVKIPQGDFVQFCIDACARGELPEKVDTVRIYHSMSRTERMVNATQVNYVNTLSVKELSKAEAIARGQIRQVHDFLKKNVPGYENSYVKGSSGTIGVRESRRITGEYTLTDHDVESGQKFPDVVVHSANFLIDIHNPDGGGQAEGVSKGVVAYDIPYRCMLPKFVENLLVTGRPISGTHRAHASYRVMNICMPMGQAAGIAAALSVQNGVSPRKLDYRLIQKELTRLGVDLFSDKDYDYPFNPSN